MNDETLQTEESSVSEATTSLPAETEVDQVADGSVIYEDLTGATEETTAEMFVTLEEFQAASSDMVHANLFGSFLICGTLIGLALLRNIHGT